MIVRPAHNQDFLDRPWGKLADAPPRPRPGSEGGAEYYRPHGTRIGYRNVSRRKSAGKPTIDVRPVMVAKVGKSAFRGAEFHGCYTPRGRGVPDLHQVD